MCIKKIRIRLEIKTHKSFIKICANAFLLTELFNTGKAAFGTSFLNDLACNHIKVMINYSCTCCK